MDSELPTQDRDVNVLPRRFGPILCDYCDSLFSACESQGPVDCLRDYHPTLGSLQNAVQSGCRLCIIIDNLLRRDGIRGKDYSHLDPCHLMEMKLRLFIAPDLSYMSIAVQCWESTVAYLFGGPEYYFAYPGTSRESFADLLPHQATLLTCLHFGRAEGCT